MAKGVKESAKQIRRIDPLPEDLFAPVKEHLAHVVEEKIILLRSNNRV
ncbi:hypothetical protein SFC42_21220 [Priestia filamentosa]